MTSSAAAVQSGQRLPCSTNSISPHRNCRLIFGGSLHPGNTCSRGWQPSHPTPAQTHICSASLQHTAPTGGLGLDLSDCPGRISPLGVPPAPCGKPRGQSWGAHHGITMGTWGTRNSCWRFLVQIFLTKSKVQLLILRVQFLRNLIPLLKLNTERRQPSPLT